VATLLGFFAHPDDEMLSGGTFARAAAEGGKVVLVCVTRGEMGEISEPHLATAENLAEVRTQELQNAAHALGLTDVRFLGFRDSGMIGTPANEDPRSFNRADPAEAIRRIVAIIREVQPNVIVTHDATGGYGHPDHIAAYRHVTDAFAAAADPAQYPNEGTAWQTDRLIYGAMPKSFFVRMRAMIEASGGDTSRFDDPQWQNLGYEDADIPIRVDVRDFLNAKLAAFNAHQTQFGPNSPMRNLPPELIAEAWGQEFYLPATPSDMPPSADSLY
jgi:LmbE family N-acetylglucosaminyl deacetylase